LAWSILDEPFAIEEPFLIEEGRALMRKSAPPVSKFLKEPFLIEEGAPS
jgi:hypothetical protein